LGFAIPSPLVELVANQLSTQGHFHRQLIGAGVQSITPTLASALGLKRQGGVIFTDIFSEGPTATAGVKLRDVVLSVNGTPIPSGLRERDARAEAWCPAP
jgi:serine protease Do